MVLCVEIKRPLNEDYPEREPMTQCRSHNPNLVFPVPSLV